MRYTLDDLLPDGAPEQLLAAYLEVHAQGAPVPAALYAKGEALYRRLAGAPPASADWGRLLVAQGELAAEHLHDDAAASRWFLEAVHSYRLHGDGEVVVTAGYDQGVLHERRGDPARAATAHGTAASEGFRLGVLAPATLRAALAAARLRWDAAGSLDDATRRLLKQAWMAWLWLRTAGREPPAEVAHELGRTLAALLLPEDDPGTLGADWRRWAPDHLATPDGTWRDDAPATLAGLYALAAEVAATHLGDEGPDPGAPYRLLHQAARRALPPG